VRIPPPANARNSMTRMITSAAGYPQPMSRSAIDEDVSSAIGRITSTQNTRPSPVATIAASTSPARSRPVPRPERCRTSTTNPARNIGYALR
jgi:hypothetical protein